MFTFKRMKLDLSLTPLKKKKKKLKQKPQNRKTLRRNIGENLGDIGFGNDFMNMTPTAQATKTKLKSGA